MTTDATTATAQLEHLCPTHLTKLTHVLRGGAGHCSKCGLFVQSINHPLPTLSPEIAAKRATAQATRDAIEAERQRKKAAVKEGRERLRAQAARGSKGAARKVKR